MWSPEQSTWSSILRDFLGVLKAAEALDRRAHAQKMFVISVSDNQCAVATATKLFIKRGQKTKRGTEKEKGVRKRKRGQKMKQGSEKKRKRALYVTSC